VETVVQEASARECLILSHDEQIQATPSRPPSTRKRRLSVKAAASRTGRKGPVRLQLEDEGDDIAEDILADLGLTPGKNVPSDGSKNELQEYEEDFEDDFEEFEEFDMGSDGDDNIEDEEDEPGPRIEDKRKKSNNLTRGGMLAILSHKDLPRTIGFIRRFTRLCKGGRLFGVPHRGAGIANLATCASKILQTTQLGFATNTNFVTALRKNLNRVLASVSAFLYISSFLWQNLKNLISHLLKFSIYILADTLAYPSNSLNVAIR
jgi:hypothetical protein